MEPIISVLNLKNGVGTSTLAWNIAHILGLNLYQHDKAIHHLFLDERSYSRDTGTVQSKNVNVHTIEKRQFKSGVYDLGSDINYGYVRQILSRSNVIVIPAELGAEVLIKTIATIQYVSQNNNKCDIFIVFNKLDNSDPARERKYTAEAEMRIEELDNTIVNRIKFYYIRYSFAMFRNLSGGYCLLDNFLRPNAPEFDIGNFKLLQHLRYYTLRKMGESKGRKDKAGREIEQSVFFGKHTPFYKDFESRVDVSALFDGTFIDNNTKVIKDMLILTTHIKEEYSLIWEGK